MAQLPGSNTLSIGYDEGAIMIKLGREQPAITMDNQGKIIWAKHSEIQQVPCFVISVDLIIGLNTDFPHLCVLCKPRGGNFNS